MIESKNDQMNNPGPSVRLVGRIVLVIVVLVGGFLLSCCWLIKRTANDIPAKEAADDAADDAGSSLSGSDLYQ